MDTSIIKYHSIKELTVLQKEMNVELEKFIYYLEATKQKKISDEDDHYHEKMAIFSEISKLNKQIIEVKNEYLKKIQHANR